MPAAVAFIVIWGVINKKPDNNTSNVQSAEGCTGETTSDPDMEQSWKPQGQIAIQQNNWGGTMSQRKGRMHAKTRNNNKKWFLFVQSMKWMFQKNIWVQCFQLNHRQGHQLAVQGSEWGTLGTRGGGERSLVVGMHTSQQILIANALCLLTSENCHTSKMGSLCGYLATWYVYN